MKENAAEADRSAQNHSEDLQVRSFQSPLPRRCQIVQIIAIFTTTMPAIMSITMFILTTKLTMTLNKTIIIIPKITAFIDQSFSK